MYVRIKDGQYFNLAVASHVLLNADPDGTTAITANFPGSIHAAQGVIPAEDVARVKNYLGERSTAPASVHFA